MKNEETQKVAFVTCFGSRVTPLDGAERFITGQFRLKPGESMTLDASVSFDIVFCDK